MKRRWKMCSLAIMLGAMVLMTGCSGSGSGGSNKAASVENDYVSVSQYTGLTVAVGEKTVITDDVIDSEIQYQLGTIAEEIEVTEDRACESGDTVYIDYEGKLDGVAFDGGTAEDYPLTLGSGTFIPGFEDAVIGHKKGETFDIDVTFPEDYGNSDLAGKPVVFTITIHKITAAEVPELTDENVQKLSDTAKTVEEYRTQLEKDLTEYVETNYAESVRTSVWNAVCENLTVKEYPADRLDALKAELINQYKSYAESYNVSYEELITDYAGYESEEAFLEAIEESAKQSIGQSLALEAIAEKEGISVNTTDKDYKDLVEELAAYYSYESGDELLTTVGETRVLESLLYNKVIDFITSNCELAEE